jgi:nucleotide-binding universal stress UspA family protein
MSDSDHRAEDYPMSYKTIMVHVDRSPDCADRIKLSASLADRFAAHLIGLCARQPVFPVVANAVSGAIVVGETPPDVEEDLRLAETAFRATVGNRASLEWRSAIELPDDYLVEQARAADLAIVGRRGLGDLKLAGYAASPGDIVLRVGRPILVVPPDWDYLTATRVVVGCKDTREARRAVIDAMPFLESALGVYVTAVGDGAKDSGAHDVVDYLQRHGVKAEAVLLNKADATPSDEIFEVAASHNADLIVAGAYGRARLREWIFGGVTHDFLQRTPVPCLLSH